MTVYIPTPLRTYTAGQGVIEIAAATIAGALERLVEAHPELRKHLFSGEGKLRAFVNLYLNDEDVRYLPAKEATPVRSSDTLSIIPSIAGGSSPDGRERFAAARQPLNAHKAANESIAGSELRTPDFELRPSWLPLPNPSRFPS